MSGLLRWLDHRTGYRQFVREALFESVPGGARWRYVWGSTLTFAIVVQFITGIFLWMFYSPSSQTAWESVYYIQEVVPGGWLLRGIHHYMAQVMTALLLLHLLQVVIDGAYRAPREVNFWFGMILLVLTLGLSLTGYLLPWDQKGFWATKVATNLVLSVPLIGEELQAIIVGGSDYGHQTLTRFFAFHAGVLPILLVLLILGHIYLFRRHGITVKEPRKGPDTHFWPDQLLKDAVACLAVFLIVMIFVWWHHGASLGAPANPAEPFSAARPDWYFMFLFQLLKLFEGEYEIWGSFIIPVLVFALFMLLPFIGALKRRIGGRRLGDWISVLFIYACLFVFIVLTSWAFMEDWQKEDHQAAVAQAERDAHRVKVLAKREGGIPPEGALALLRDDPVTQGPRLFKSHCANCHTYGGEDGMGNVVTEPSASDLKGFASREWLTDFLHPDHIVSSAYWGNTAFVDVPEGERPSKMVAFVLDDIAEFAEIEQEMLRKLVIGLSAEAKLPAQAELDAEDAAIIGELEELIGEDGLACTDCHHFRGEGRRPDLTGYGSREWMIEFIKDPAQKRFYGERNDRMPSYGGVKDENGELIEPAKLTDREIGLIVDWLRGAE